MCKPLKRFYLSFFQVPSTQDLWKLKFPVLEFLDSPDNSHSFLKPTEGRPWLYAFRGFPPLSRVRVKADEFLCCVFAGTEPFRSIYLLRVVYICEESYFQLPSLHGPKALSLYSIRSVQFSRSVMSNPLRPHGLQHARPPCPSPTSRVYSNPCPLSR